MTIRLNIGQHDFSGQCDDRVRIVARANALGASWLERHQEFIDPCPVKPEVIRWGHWYDHLDYPEVFDGVSRAYATSAVLREAIENDVSGFFRRLGREPTTTERRHSRDYLVEEVAVITLQARELSSLKLYPGDELQCLNVVRRGLVPEAPRGLEREQFAKVRFHMRGNSAAKELCGHQPPCPTAEARRTPTSLLVLNS